MRSRPKRSTSHYQLPFGAHVTGEGVEFSVWAPNATEVDVELIDPANDRRTRHPLSPGRDGRFSGTIMSVGDGARYRFRLDGVSSFPDPYSRYQPEGPHGPSEVVDPAGYQWRCLDWQGHGAGGLVIYECHIGAMTAEGTYAALTQELPELARLGVTAVELMPVAEFPGRWNWGYDGVDLFAPSHTYGRLEDLKNLIDTAHELGLAVFLDVVYNHLGPDGNYLRSFSRDYFTDRHQTPWGEAVNYDGPNSRFVRDFVISNACYWLAEYRFDGLRLDATDQIVDDSSPHILRELTERARASVAPRPVTIVAEEARNEVRTIRPVATGGFGLDGVWADDFHHAARVFLTGVRGNYLDNFRGTTAELAKTIDNGFLFQGQTEPGSGRPRGTVVTDEPASAFVFCIQNHDQVGNRAFGERLHYEIDIERYKVVSALLLFLPYTQLLFMGQEFAASASFHYFTDHHPDLGKLVTEGRREEFKGFAAFADPQLRESIPDPQDPQTFFRTKLNLNQRALHAPVYELYRALLWLRREDPVVRGGDRFSMRADAIGAQILLVRRWLDNQLRLFVANFGPSVGLTSSLLTSPALHGVSMEDSWRLLLATSDARFGGYGDECGLVERETGWRLELPARSAAIFAVSRPG